MESSSPKLRLMCSNGGHIIPRPYDKSLCYVGGETRMVVVDRHTTLLDLTHRLSKTLLRSPANGYSFTLKYQLPSEDLDSLISVTSDEDLENMIEEYEKLNSSSRLRLFVFPKNPESVTSIGSFLLNSVKSENDWFANALNGTNLGFSDYSSVNCLLGLEDEISLPEKKDDSLIMETFSSFGSASSTPSLANLPPVNVNSDDHQKVIGGTEQKQSVLSDHTSNNILSVDPNDPLDQNARTQNPACLLSMPTTQTNSPRNQLHHQQPQFIPPLPYYHHHHHPSGAVPVTSYYQQPPMDQQNFVYYMPPRQQLPQGYNFPLQQPQPSAAQPVRAQYVGYGEMHQPSPLIYYATQAVPPLSAAQYRNMTSSLQEQVRTALP